MKLIHRPLYIRTGVSRSWQTATAWSLLDASHLIFPCHLSGSWQENWSHSIGNRETRLMGSVMLTKGWSVWHMWRESP